jgi:hypothetical protein
MAVMILALVVDETPKFAKAVNFMTHPSIISVRKIKQSAS